MFAIKRLYQLLLHLIRPKEPINIFNKCWNWSSYKSEHFTVNYCNKSNIHNSIDDLTSCLEHTYNDIAKILEINIDMNINIFLSPSIEFCIRNGLPINSLAIPHKRIVFMVFDNIDKYFIMFLRHEIAHIFSFTWDREIYHIELLEEGLACYLGDIQADHHKIWVSRIQKNIKASKHFDLSLLIATVSRSTDYDKAASFVKYLVDQYGIARFRQLFIKSHIEKKGTIYRLNGKKVPEHHLYLLLGQIYAKDPIEIQFEWLKELELSSRGLILPSIPGSELSKSRSLPHSKEP